MTDERRRGAPGAETTAIRARGRPAGANYRPARKPGRGNVGPGAPIVKRGIATRIAKLERRSSIGRGEFYVIAMPAGRDGGEALAALGLAPGPADLVVLITNFFGATKPGDCQKFRAGAGFIVPR